MLRLFDSVWCYLIFLLFGCMCVRICVWRHDSHVACAWLCVCVCVGGCGCECMCVGVYARESVFVCACVRVFSRARLQRGARRPLHFLRCLLVFFVLFVFLSAECGRILRQICYIHEVPENLFAFSNFFDDLCCASSVRQSDTSRALSPSSAPRGPTPLVLIVFN